MNKITIDKRIRVISGTEKYLHRLIERKFIPTKIKYESNLFLVLKIIYMNKIEIIDSVILIIKSK